jgi:hypothetical protein
LDVINNYIIPHFDSYPLLGIKYLDYQLFKMGIKLINNGDYKNPEGLLKFSKYAILMNEGDKKNIIGLFPDLINFNNTVQNKLSNFKDLTGLTISPIFNTILNSWWLTGFINGDGSFSASIKSINLNKLAFQPSLSISQHKNNILDIQ